MNEMEQKVLKTLSHQYKNIAAASTEIINLQSILNLPKGTEHFLTDIHGEYEQFNHVLKNGSGSVRRKIDEEFGNTISNKDKKSLATLIYYPESKLEIVEREEDNLEDWYKISLHRLVQVIKRVSSKYTRSKVRKALPKDFAYVIEELITEKEEIQDKEAYYNEIIHTIIRIGRAPQFIIALSHLIQQLVIDHLHIVGDIYDRGPGPHIIMDTLCEYHSVDVQWGNHDMVWMGAAAGSLACIANVVRMSARYGNLATLEDGYGINLLPLATFALETYENTNCDAFTIKFNTDYNTKDLGLDTKMHKAIAILQFKLEGQLIMRHPEFHMELRVSHDQLSFQLELQDSNCFMHLGVQPEILGIVIGIELDGKGIAVGILISFQCKCSQRQQVDAVAILQSGEITVSGRHSDHIGDTGQTSGRRAHPHHVMVAPLDIHGMVFAQSIHNNMRAGTSVVNITDDMQMIDDQLLDQVA